MNAVKDKKGNYNFPTIQEDKCLQCVTVCEENARNEYFTKSLFKVWPPPPESKRHK